MNVKNIEKHLRHKFDEWVLSIKDKKTQELVKNNSIITGGCIVSLLRGDKINDYDIYFRNKETVLAVANYYTNQFNKLNNEHSNRLGFQSKAYVLDGDADLKRDENNNVIGIINSEIHKDFSNQCQITRMIMSTPKGRVKIIVRSDGIAEEDEEKREDVINLFSVADEVPANSLSINEDNQIDSSDFSYRPVFLSTNAITLSDDIQCVIRFYGSPKEIHETYDFVHCTNYWCSWTDKVTLKKEALEAILTNELVYIGSKYPLCSIIRTRKFIKRGWWINAGQYLKMAFQLNELDLKNIDVLEDQLVGVDTLYFEELISRLHRADIDLTADYVCSVVDKVF